VIAAYCYTRSSRNHVLDGARSSKGRGQFFGVVCPIEKHWEPLLWRMQERLNRSRCHLGVDSCGSRSDEFIRCREGWQDGDVAFSPNFFWPFVYLSPSSYTTTFVLWSIMGADYLRCMTSVSILYSDDFCFNPQHIMYNFNAWQLHGDKCFVAAAKQFKCY